MQHSSPFPGKAFGNNLQVRSHRRATRTQKLFLTTQGPFSFSIMAASLVIIPTFEAKQRKEKKSLLSLSRLRQSSLCLRQCCFCCELTQLTQGVRTEERTFGGQGGGAKMRNVPFAQLTTCKNLTVLTELGSDTTKNMLARCKQRIYSKCSYQSFGMVGLFISIRIV